jgi:photosystem II stability/assembly factor-like uncharacterized protein
MNHTLSRWGRLLLGLVLIGSSCLLPASPALADPGPIALTEIQPNSISNDVDTPVEISGSGFSNTGGLPQVFLGRTALRDVAWVSDQALTAVVPWGLAPARYALKVVNPDGGEASRSDAIEVTQGIGQWNSQALDGGPVQVVLPVAKTPGLLYAYSNVTNAVYKSTDYAATWQTVGHAGGQFLSIDQVDPNYLYLGQMRSSDGGATWVDTLEGQPWPGQEAHASWFAQTFPDPVTSGTVFLASPEIPVGSGSAKGLLRSTDHGQNWTSVSADMVDDPNVTAIAYGDGVIYAGTRDGYLYQSINGGANWSRIGDTKLQSSIGVLAINPYKVTEMWVATHFDADWKANILKIDLSDPTNAAKQVDVWPDGPSPVGLEGDYPMTIGFVSQDKVFISTRWDRGWITENGGTNWNSFQPQDGKPGNCLSIDPNNPNIFYMADEQYGVQKTTDGGAHWNHTNTGLHAMAPDILAVDPSNPARVYSKISQNGWPGIFVSQDGGQNWAFSPMSVASDPPGYRPVTSTLAANSSRVFAGAHGNGVFGWGPNLYVSNDQGGTWDRILVDPDPVYTQPEYENHFYMPWALQVDPNNASTLVMTAVIGNRSMRTDQYFSEIYRSTDNGDTWERANLKTQLGHDVLNLRYLAFNPVNSDEVYAAADHEILKSTDNGVTWADVKQVGLDQWVGSPIAIEPVAPFRVYVGALVSLDAGATWNPANLPMGGNSQMVFVPGSDTLYMAGSGLQVSPDGGDTWQSASGGLAETSISALTVAKIGSRIVVYVGTPGGDALAGTGLTGQASSPLEAGVYRMTRIHTNIYLPLVKH